MRAEPVLQLGYLVGALQIVLPALDVALRTWPPRPGDVTWRFGAGGILFGSIATPLIGVLLLLAAAALTDRPVLVRVIGGATAFASLTIGLLLPLFALDWAQLRGSMDSRALREFDRNSLQVLFEGALCAAAGLWMGVASWRAVRKGRPSAPVVSGRPKADAA